MKLSIIFLISIFVWANVAFGQKAMSSKDEQLFNLARTNLKAFAQQVSRGTKSELGQSQALVRWLASNFEWKATDYQKRTVQEIIERKGGNCNELAMVLTAAMKELGIKLRRVHEVNIHVNTPRRGVDAHAMVKEKGLTYSVFGRHHNDHIWLELYDTATNEWYPADPSSGLVGTEDWLKGRVWFGKRVTLNPITEDMIVPFAVFAADENGKFTINRTRHYVIDEFDKLYKGKLHSHPAWQKWSDGIDFLDEKVAGAFAGTVNLHDYEAEIDSLAEIYEQLKASFSDNKIASTARIEFDYAGVDAFWRIQDVLAKDVEPQQNEWNSLFSTHGYALLDEKEHRRQRLTDAMRLAFMPSKINERNEVLKEAENVRAVMVSHFLDVVKYRGEISEFLQKDSLKKLFGDARQLAQTLLPDGLTDRSPPPLVSFFFFQSRGYRERLVLDALDLVHHPNPAGLVAHEFHHHYYHFVSDKKGFTKDPGDDLAWAIVNVEVEGVAGILDKGDVPQLSAKELEKRYREKGQSDYFKQYQIEYARSGYWLKVSEKYLEQIADDPVSAKALGTKLHDELPDNGRAMGTFMAKTIIDVLGRARLIDTVGDSYEFWKVYNDAAKRAGKTATILSNKAMLVIIKLQKTYAV